MRGILVPLLCFQIGTDQVTHYNQKQDQDSPEEAERCKKYAQYAGGYCAEHGFIHLEHVFTIHNFKVVSIGVSLCC